MRLRIRNLLRFIFHAVSGLIYRGDLKWCPVCESGSRRFLPYGQVPRPDAMCPQCGALERHRLVWLFFSRRTDLFDDRPKKVLHIAPEPALTGRLAARIRGDYVTGDLLDPGAMVRLDITDIEFPDASFDVIYCSHVLEHVQEDRKAMRELFRILRASGWALVVVPITAPATIEDANIAAPADRLREYGQEDHVRRYGPDFRNRLESVGFEVTVVPPSALLIGSEAERYGLVNEKEEAALFMCRRT